MKRQTIWIIVGSLAFIGVSVGVYLFLKNKRESEETYGDEESGEGEMTTKEIQQHLATNTAYAKMSEAEKKQVQQKAKEVQKKEQDDTPIWVKEKRQPTKAEYDAQIKKLLTKK